jgi:hypothetical protein
MLSALPGLSMKPVVRTKKQMKRPLLIAIFGLLLCAATWWLSHGGTRTMIHAYQDTDFAQQRALRKFLRYVAADFETRQREPPVGKPGEFHVDFNDWGHPLQYGWEDGVAVVRGAGKDRKLYTRDDITICVQLTNKMDKGSNNGIEHTR